MGKQGESRFKTLVARSGRDWDASKAVVSILRADSKAAQAIERALARADLTLPQFNVLMVLANSAEGRIPLYELNAQLVSTPPNTTWLTNRMVERGFVTKSRDAKDGRVVLIEITEQGWATLASAAPLVFETEKTLLKGFTKTELRTLGDLLARLL